MRWTILAPAQSDFVCYCFEERLCACIFHQPKPSCTNFMSLILCIPMVYSSASKSVAPMVVQPSN